MRKYKHLFLSSVVVILLSTLFAFCFPYTITVDVSITPKTNTAIASPKAPHAKKQSKQKDQVDLALELAPELKTPRGLLKEIFILSRKIDKLTKDHDETSHVVASLIRSSSPNRNAIGDQTKELKDLRYRVDAIEGRMFSIESMLRRR